MRKTTLRYCGALGSLLGPLLLQACQDSTQICEPVTGPDGTVGRTCFEFGDFGKSTLAQSSPEPAGDNCPDGGKRIDTGFDDNDNGTLDASEVDASTYICDGEDGAPGKSALTAVTPVDPGEDCVNGGVRVNYGIDADEDGTLSEEESAGTHFVCNGPAGADGDDGSNGSDGIDGEDGAQGAVGAQGAQGIDGATGPQGPQGADGIDGATGPQGADGTNGIDGATGPQGPQGADGTNGIDGATGPQGPQGADGIDGATGPQGPQGTSGSDSIATFASGAPAVMTTAAGGVQGDVVIVGFGETTTTSALGGLIDGTTLDSLAFSVPRDGTLTSIAGFFNLRTAMALVGTTVSITGQVYISSTPDNTFVPVPGAIVTLAPSLTGVLATGTVLNGTTTGLSIPVTQGSRVMFVFGSTAAGVTLINSVNGTFSAGLTIN